MLLKSKLGLFKTGCHPKLKRRKDTTNKFSNMFSTRWACVQSLTGVKDKWAYLNRIDENAVYTIIFTRPK